MDDTVLDALAVLHHRLDTGYLALGEMSGAPDATNEALASGFKKLQWLGKQYISEIAKLRRTVDRHDLFARRRELTARLTAGWAMEPTDRLSQDTIDQQFARLLGRYVVVCDLLMEPKDLVSRVEREPSLIAAAIHMRASTRQRGAA